MMLLSQTLLLSFIATSCLIHPTTARTNSQAAFSPIGTGCCPPGPEFPGATSHPNATGTFPIVGLYLDDSAVIAKITSNTNNASLSLRAPRNWTWSTSVMEVRLGNSGANLSATNQIFTLDIPIDEDIYNKKHQRNVCVLLLEMITVNQNDPGRCENIFTRRKVEGMRAEFVRRVEEMREFDEDFSPCAGMGATSWQEIISSYHRGNSTLAARNTSVAAQYHSSTSSHPSADTSAYDTALVRTQPIFLLGYSVDPTVLAGPAIVKRELVETRLSCVRVREVAKGSRGQMSGAGNSVGGLLMTVMGKGVVGVWFGVWVGLLVF
ncbi:hypothetical protein ACO22_02278 [Paracoccidioides brasiliensis]|uniref:Uncharacterized protein n=1 Tax=Paracoccidioides brasiliensis TaxID=121759 RepID=A0A1D2JJ68_PARBR|nr:hypothetical protein ACO22_02278 [Paracoccidioides brasiliensis]